MKRPPFFSIRQPDNEPPQDWDEKIVARVQYIPGEPQLVREVERALKRKELNQEMVELVAEWGRRSDFLRLYQAIYVGSRLQKLGINHVHAHFAGMAARTAFWINKFFGVPFSFTAHANDIFAPKEFETGLGKLIGAASAVVAVSDYAANFLKERFSANAAKIHRIYNGLDLSRFKRADFASAVPAIVSIGRLIDKKGFADLIRACDLLKKRGRDFRCEIIGEGPLENDLRGADRGAQFEIAGKFGWPKNSNANCPTACENFGVCLAVCGRSRWREGQLADGDHGSDGCGSTGCFDNGWRNSGNGRAR